MNGVAKAFWNEVFDVWTPIGDPREKRTSSRRKKVRQVLTRRPTRQAP